MRQASVACHPQLWTHWHVAFGSEGASTRFRFVPPGGHLPGFHYLIPLRSCAAPLPSSPHQHLSSFVLAQFFLLLCMLVSFR